MNCSKIDLHCHSNCSDGALSPEDLLLRASEKGVEYLALTDHDTIAGQLRAAQAANAHSIHMISGIELSCVWAGYTIHVLGLNFDLDTTMTKTPRHQNRINILKFCGTIIDNSFRIDILHFNFGAGTDTGMLKRFN